MTKVDRAVLAVADERPALADTSSVRRCIFGGSWSVIAPRRAHRPVPAETYRNQQNERCPFCNGNERDTEPEVFALRPQGGPPDSAGWQVRVVPNKFPALAAEARSLEQSAAFHPQVAARGVHEVVVESPHHKPLGHFSLAELETVLGVYRSRIQSLRTRRGVRSIALFRNEGPAAGASQAHPHTQILGLPIVPTQQRRDLSAAARHLRRYGTCLTCQIVGHESVGGGRLVLEDDQCLVLTSFAPRFPYETWLVPKRHGHDFGHVTDAQLGSVAAALKRVLLGLEMLLGAFPFNLILHTAPVRVNGLVSSAFHWRFEIVPRLTIPSGFELGSDVFIVGVSPEAAASALRASAP